MRAAQTRREMAGAAGDGKARGQWSLQHLSRVPGRAAAPLQATLARRPDRPAHRALPATPEGDALGRRAPAPESPSRFLQRHVPFRRPHWRGQHQVTYPHDPVLVALSACVPRRPDVRRHRDRRRSPLCRSQQRQRGEIHTFQPSCSRAWRTVLRQQVRGTQGGSGIEETRPHREVGLGSEMCADF
jgi:hypothetical protein